MKTKGILAAASLLLPCLILSPVLPSGELTAQASTEVTFGGQIRPRTEGRKLRSGDWGNSTSMRVRAALEAKLERGVRVFMQLQDVRLFGEESNTLSDYRADNFDLHQGFLEFGDVPGLGGVFRVGRQELAFGEQRLVGSVNWTQQGRSFDGLRYTRSLRGSGTLDLFGTKLREEASETHQWESSFAGAYGTFPLGAVGSAEVYGLLTTDGRPGNGNELTVGALWRGEVGPLDLRFEGSLQSGERDGSKVSAHMVGARAGVELIESVRATLWYDFLSGDKDPADDEVGVFNTLFATNHAFYGYADYFLDIPTHTGGLGLQDTAVKLSFDLSPRTSAGVDLHNFRSAAAGELPTRSLANEIDITLTHRFTGQLAFTGGYSFVQAKEGIRALGRLEEDAHWAYLMLDAAF